MEIVSSVSILAAIIGVVQVLKMSGLPSRFAPLASLLLGVSFSIYFLHDSSYITVFAGVVAGLTSSGLWSSSKSLIGN